MAYLIDVNLIWGVILISVTLKCWIGQTIIAFSPKVAAKIRIIEPESDVDPNVFCRHVWCSDLGYNKPLDITFCRNIATT